jgi:hypothetical protein
MDQYIKQLLLLHSKIILPQFGAIFIANEESGELSFNEYLSYDDGKLSNLLEKESNMDLQEAQNTVAKFVRDLKLQLDKGETYSIFQLGEFSKSDDGSFIFEGNVKTGGVSANDKFSGPSPTPTVNPAAVANDETSEKTEETKANPTSKKEEKSMDKTSTPIDSTTKTKTEQNTEAKKNVYVENKTDEQSPVKPKEKTEPQTVTTNKEVKHKRGFLFWFLLLFLISIIAVGTFGVINYEKVENYMGWDLFNDNSDSIVNSNQENVEKEVSITKEPEEEIVLEESLAEEETIQEESLVEEEEETVQEEFIPVSPTTGNHYIVIGCFNEKSNAKGLVSDFKQKGFDSKIINQFGGLYFVVAQSYPTFQAAKSDLARVRLSIEGAWLYKN